jgi:hypothetical protein
MIKIDEYDQNPELENKKSLTENYSEDRSFIKKDLIEKQYRKEKEISKCLL